MKTTVDIADQLLRKAKKLATKQNTTLKAVIESALREALDSAEHPPQRFCLETHTVDGNGLQQGLSWDDWSAIRSLGYEGRGG